MHLLIIPKALNYSSVVFVSIDEKMLLSSISSLDLALLDTLFLSSTKKMDEIGNLYCVPTMRTI